MNAIVGIFARDGRPVGAADVHPMEAAAGRFSTPPVRSSAGACLWFNGRLDNAHEFALDPSHNRDCSSDAGAALAAYEQRGERFVSHLNGDFSLALIDAARRTLVLARDVMAAEPLFYCPLPGLVLFASEIKCLLAHPEVSPVPDEEGLAELVLDYWCDEHRTCFDGIYTVPPGHSVVATAAAITRRCDWSFDPGAQIRYSSFQEYCEHFRILFKRAVRRRLRTKAGVAIAVSGGLDSSSIFCEAVDVWRRESTPAVIRGISMTFPSATPADERELLSDIEQSCSLPITAVPVSRYSYMDKIESTVRCLDTPGAVESSQFRIFEAARHAGCDVLLSGFFGDQMLSRRAYLVDLAKSGRWLKIRHDIRECSAWMTDVDPELLYAEFWKRLVRDVPPGWLFRLVKKVFFQPKASRAYPPWFSRRFREAAVDRASRRFESSLEFATTHTKHYHLSATAGHYRNVVRCERAVAAAHGIDLQYPFRDRDLVAFVMAIPGEIVNWQGVPKGLLRHALADLLPSPIRDRRWKADFTALENSAMRRDARSIAKSMSFGSLSARLGFVDPRAVQHTVDIAAAMNDTDGPMPGWRLTDLAGLEAWLRSVQWRQ